MCSNWKHQKLAIIVILWPFFLPSILPAKTLYVDQRAEGQFDGSSWVHAFTDLQEALRISQYGDRVLVAKGLYKPTASEEKPDATFALVKGVTLEGGYAGLGHTDPNIRDNEQYPTVLSGDLKGDDELGWTKREDNAFHVLIAVGTDANTVVDGFIIADGRADDTNRSWIDAAPITRVERDQGGGLYLAEQSGLTLKGCVFRENTSAEGGGAIAMQQGSTLDVHKCEFIRNVSPRESAGINGKRSGTNLVITRCHFYDNTCENGAHAIGIENGRLTATHCTFYSNGPTHISSAVHGRTLLLRGTITHLVNCLFSGNKELPIECFTGKLNLLNCTLVGNQVVSSNWRAGAINSMNTLLTITNSIIWGNTNEPTTHTKMRYQITHYGAERSFFLQSNLIESWRDSGTSEYRERYPQQPEPLFVDADGPDNVAGNADDDLRLLPGSPGIDGGWFDPDVNLPETDLDDHPRVVNGNVDMGAYEFAGIIYVDDHGLHYHYAGPGNGTINSPFPDLNFALDIVGEGQTIELAPGTYHAPSVHVDQAAVPWYINKNITLRSQFPADPFFAANDTILAGPIVFSGSEDANCVLTGLRIQHPEDGAIYGNHTQATLNHCYIVGNGPCDGSVLVEFDGLVENCLIADNIPQGDCGEFPVIYRCNATFKNCTIASNHSGIMVERATFENCILYHNADPNIYLLDGGELNLSHCTIEGGIGEGGAVGNGSLVTLGSYCLNAWQNISDDPLFARIGRWSRRSERYEEGDYHLQSEGGRWSEGGRSRRGWVFDDVTSPCIDAGDPEAGLGEELLHVPSDPTGEFSINLRINQGFYGGTDQASLAPIRTGAGEP